MEVTRFQENKGEQVTSLKAQTQTSPITSFSLLWPKQVKNANPDDRDKETDSTSQRDKKQKPVTYNSKLLSRVNS